MQTPSTSVVPIALTSPAVDPRIRLDRTLPPLPYVYQPSPPQGYHSYGSGPLLPPTRPHGLVSDPVPVNAFVAKLNMDIEPIVVRDLVNSKRAKRHLI